MSLQVWLPLNGNTNNQGVASVTVTNNGATSYNIGKIGKCYYFNGSSWIKISLPSGMTSIKNTTVAMWVKGGTAFGGISHDGDTTSGACITFYDKYWQVIGDSTYIAAGKGQYDSVGDDSWHHVACATSDTGLSMYLDGALVSTASISANKIKTDLPSGAFIEIGADHPGGDEFLTGYVNDFRVYDHCLSTREVKELSKGLVCHYPLNQPERSPNLLPNTNKGKSNWAFSAADGSTSVEEYDDDGLKCVKMSCAKVSTSWSYQQFYIPVNVLKSLKANTNYTLSFDVKSDYSVNGTISIKRGSATGKLTEEYAYSITGDEQWHRVVVNLYTNALTETLDTQVVYFLGVNAVGYRIIKNLKLEEGINTNPKWSPAPSDSPNWGLIEYDTSGYKNNGTVTTANTPVYTSDSPRYGGCYSFNGTDQYINIGKGGKVRDAITVAWWGYMDSWDSYGRAISCTEGGGWNFEPINNVMSFLVGCGTSSNTYQRAKSNTNLANLSAGWHHWVGTYDGFKVCLYRDGVLDNSDTPYTTKTMIYNSDAVTFIGCEANNTVAGTPYFKGKISDVRIYATALSAEDVKELYNTPFSVSNMGVLMVQGEVQES